MMKIKLLKPGMEVKFWYSYKSKDYNDEPEVGYFQMWGIDFLELEDGIGSCTAAIVMSCGCLSIVPVGCVVVTEVM